MSELNKILKIVETAEASLRVARQMLEKMDGQNVSEISSPAPHSFDGLSIRDEGDNQIIEGIFDGQNMIGPNGKIYPVPANYASKSKLLEGDKLKLTVLPDGSLLYKQIEPIPRKHIRGTLVKEDGQFKVLTGDKAYKVLLASVTYYKGNLGDEVSVIVPENENSTWATIEALIPH